MTTTTAAATTDTSTPTTDTSTTTTTTLDWIAVHVVVRVVVRVVVHVVVCVVRVVCVLGAGSGLVPMYLTEIAPINIRGAMGVLHQLALTCGILVSQLLGLRELLGGADIWPYLLAGSAVPFILSCLVLPWYPDSPRWLLVKKDNRPEAIAGKPGRAVKVDLLKVLYYIA